MVTDSGSGHTSVGVKRIASNISVDAGLDCPSHGQNSSGESALPHRCVSIDRAHSRNEACLSFLLFQANTGIPYTREIPVPQNGSRRTVRNGSYFLSYIYR